METMCHSHTACLIFAPENIEIRINDELKLKRFTVSTICWETLLILALLSLTIKQRGATFLGKLRSQCSLRI